MKAISLWQPWASFIAAGLKPYETRDWAPPHHLIGQRIAVHATKRDVPLHDMKWAFERGLKHVPLGVVVCTAKLAGAYECGSDSSGLVRVERCRGPVRQAIHSDEFGDYGPARWAWLLTDIEAIDPPIAARGMQGFWEWTP